MKKSTNDWLASLNLQDRIRALALIYSHLTVISREFFLPDVTPTKDRTRLAALQGINELHHKLAGQLVGYSGSHGTAYPLDVFCAAIFEIADYYRVTDYLKAALDFAQTRDWGVGAGGPR